MEKQIAFINETSYDISLWAPTIEEFNRLHIFRKWNNVVPGSFFMLGINLCIVREVQLDAHSQFIIVIYEFWVNYFGKDEMFKELKKPGKTPGI